MLEQNHFKCNQIEVISHHVQNGFFAPKFHIDDYWAPIVLKVYMGANEITGTKIEASILWTNHVASNTNTRCERGRFCF